MRAGQQGPQLSARVFLNHDLVTDCACVYTKECALFLPSDRALSVFGVDRRLLAVFLFAILDGFVQWPVPDSLVQEAVKMVTSPSHWLMLHTFIALCPSSNLECISWRVGPTCLANTCRYQHTHTLSLSFCVYAEWYV